MFGITSIDQNAKNAEQLANSLVGYANYVKGRPNTAVVLNIGARDDDMTQAFAVKFVKSLQASGLEPGAIVVTSPAPQEWNKSAEATISVIEAEPAP